MGSCESIFRKRSIEKSQIIDTDTGSLEGLKETYDGEKYDIYMGIPYAEPPVGNLRFQVKW